MGIMITVFAIPCYSVERNAGASQDFQTNTFTLIPFHLGLTGYPTNRIDIQSTKDQYT